MLIDWFTVGAQALNFLILVWLMQRFLYRPILRAIDAREKRIASELADADQKKGDAQKERDVFQNKNEEFDRQRAELLSQMNDDVESERFRLLDEARAAADAVRGKRMETLRGEARNLNQAIGRRAQQEVFEIARKTLAALASAGLEERVFEVFLQQLRALGAAEKAALRPALTGSPEAATVRSAFALSADQRAALEQVIRSLTGAEGPFCFETRPELVCGIDLTVNGRKMAWSVEDYLQSLEKGVGELLDTKDPPEPQVAPLPEVTGSGTTPP